LIDASIKKKTDAVRPRRGPDAALGDPMPGLMLEKRAFALLLIECFDGGRMLKQVAEPIR
jgi:hypothetical protein